MLEIAKCFHDQIDNSNSRCPKSDFIFQYFQGKERQENDRYNGSKIPSFQTYINFGELFNDHIKSFCVLVHNVANFHHVKLPDPRDDKMPPDNSRGTSICPRQHNIVELLKQN